MYIIGYWRSDGVARRGEDWWMSFMFIVAKSSWIAAADVAEFSFEKNGLSVVVVAGKIPRLPDHRVFFFFALS